MGNRSSYIFHEGCILDRKLIDETHSEFRGDYDANKLLEMGLGEFLDGWKLQGYWYDSTKKFLGMVAKAMVNLTDSGYDNYIEMEEEEGFRFKVLFYKGDDGDIIVELDAHIMDTYQERLWSLEESRMEVLK